MAEPLDGRASLLPGPRTADAAKPTIALLLAELLERAHARLPVARPDEAARSFTLAAHFARTLSGVRRECPSGTRPPATP